jgi:ATP-binding cassette subfamily F protein 3
MCRSDLLLLDEPTNHLDLDAVLWLEQWLREYRGTLLLIAHDREFLDRVVNRIINIEHGKARAYRGNYSAFEEIRAAELAQNQALYARQQREITHIESFIARFRAKASKARQAQSRIKALERMQRIAPAHIDSEFRFAFLEPAKLPRPLLGIENQAVGYSDRVLVGGTNFTISPGDRIALLGRNGAGKSTLIKMLGGELPGIGGKRTEAKDLRIGYFAQHQLEQLNVAESPLQHLRRLGGEAADKATEQELRDFLASFGFRGERVFETIGPFSGGEKARLVLALLSYLRPNLLLLDEPTNHLDLEMRQALALALQEYSGAVLLVSHDRHLLRTVVDEFYVVGNGHATPFDGDLDDYSRWLADNTEDVSESSRADSGESRKQRKREDAERRNRLSPLKAELEKIERRLTSVTMDLQALEVTLAEAELYTTESKARLQETLQRQTKLKREVDELESAWLECHERLEAASA